MESLIGEARASSLLLTKRHEIILYSPAHPLSLSYPFGRYSTIDQIETVLTFCRHRPVMHTFEMHVSFSSAGLMFEGLQKVAKPRWCDRCTWARRTNRDREIPTAFATPTIRTSSGPSESMLRDGRVPQGEPDRATRSCAPRKRRRPWPGVLAARGHDASSGRAQVGDRPRRL